MKLANQIPAFHPIKRVFAHATETEGTWITASQGAFLLLLFFQKKSKNDRELPGIKIPDSVILHFFILLSR
jgi:hypothetical protein